jgi:flagellar protein FliO/FliZ
MEMGDHILQVLLALGLVVGLVVALGFAMKRINSGGFKSGGEIKVVASTFLGPKERILLLQVRDRQVLVGANPNGIRALSEFPAPPGGSSGDTSADNQAGGGFERALREAAST